MKPSRYYFVKVVFLPKFSLFLVCNHVTRRPCWGSKQKNISSKNLHENRVQFPEERKAFVLDQQHGRRDVTCKPAIKLRLTDQYKTRRTIQKLIVSNHTQNFRNNKDRKVLKLQFENLRLLSIYRRCFSFFTVDDWLKLFHKLTTDEVQGTGQNLEQELFNHKNTYKITQI